MSEQKCLMCGRDISRKAFKCKSCAMIGNKHLLGHIPTAATRAKISTASTGRKHTIEAKAKQSQAHLRENNPHWNGGVCYIRGYKQILCPDHPRADFNGYVPEHRLIMEQKLGRFLKSGEVVHHLDLNISNNAPENLDLFQSTGEHISYHARLNFYMQGM